MSTEPARPDFAARMAEIAARRATVQPHLLCQRHADATYPHGYCEVCEQERSAEAAADIRARRVEQAVESCDARFPARYRNAAADEPDIVAWVETYVADPTGSMSLLIVGPTGVGKSYQAYGALRASVVGSPTTWRATTSADLMAALRPRSGVDTEGVLEQYRDCGLLFIDDFGVAKNSEWVEETTYRLINGRYERMLPSIYTTNLAISQLRDELGDRIASRLAETCVRVVLKGVDRRRRPA